MIAQADRRKWMACLYNSFLFMEAKIMKMAKKLLAVVLAGVKIGRASCRERVCKQV